MSRRYRTRFKGSHLVLLAALGALPGCGLLMLPFQLIGSLVSKAVELAPEALPYLFFFAQVPVDSGFDLPGSEVPGTETEARAYFASLEDPPRVGSDPASVQTLLARLMALPRASTPVRVVFLRPGADPTGELSRFLENDRRSYLVRARLLPGVEGAQARVRLVEALAAKGTEVLDRTPLGRPTAHLLRGTPAPYGRDDSEAPPLKSDG